MMYAGSKNALVLELGATKVIIMFFPVVHCNIIFHIIMKQLGVSRKFKPPKNSDLRP